MLIAQNGQTKSNNSSAICRQYILIDTRISALIFEFIINSRVHVFCKKAVLKKFVRFTGKHFCRSFIFIKVAGHEKVTPTQVFCCEFCQSFQNVFFIEHFWWLLLNNSESNHQINVPFLMVISLTLYTKKC